VRIAILEDDVALASLVEMTLAEAGHTCDVYGDGQLMTRALHRTTYDLLILDWNVPGLSGLEVIAWIKANLDLAPPRSCSPAVRPRKTSWPAFRAGPTTM
jgi:DNA-binding response OmpR family regulator